MVIKDKPLSSIKADIVHAFLSVRLWQSQPHLPMGPASRQNTGPLFHTNSGHPPVFMCFCQDHHCLPRPSACWELHSTSGSGELPMARVCWSSGETSLRLRVKHRWPCESERCRDP